jgi:hypothetical protein
MYNIRKNQSKSTENPHDSFISVNTSFVIQFDYILYIIEINQI